MIPALRCGTKRAINNTRRVDKSDTYRLLTGLIFCLALLLSGCTKPPAPQATPLPVVNVEEAKPSEAHRNIVTTGLVKPWQEAKLSFQVPGQILQGPTAEGVAVAQGAVLAVLDNADYQAQAESASHQLELTRVEVERTQADLQRVEQLFAAGAVPEKNLEDARFANRAALARAGQAQSALDQAELAVNHSSLQAPFAGEVLKRLGEKGEMVAAGTPVILLGQLDPVKISITAAAGDTSSWPVGAEVLVGAGPVAETNGDNSGQKAVVHSISPGAEGYTGSFEVVLKLANADRNLRPGQVVNVERQVVTAPALWVPFKSVVSRGEALKYVFVYQPGDGTVKQLPVALGPVSGDRIQVTQGLEAGDLVLVMMPGDLKDGARVEVKENGPH
ncbi:MAG: hypothetical protein VR67_02870 [Peptococcaceae bacterium BRH_c8a]|nr:MAG: hypothetical protein VR67_02870 [Peptococcaceae bacterium BRH_c8a]